MMEKVNTTLERLDHLHLSLHGRCNVLKMMVLPKFLYLFRTIPVEFSPLCFNKLERYALDLCGDIEDIEGHSRKWRYPDIVGAGAFQMFCGTTGQLLCNIFLHWLSGQVLNCCNVISHQFMNYC